MLPALYRLQDELFGGMYSADKFDYNIDIGIASADATHDIIVEVFVGCEADHAAIVAQHGALRGVHGFRTD